MSKQSEEFKQHDASSYDDVALYFDRFTDRFSRPLAERLTRLARLGPGDRVLDVGTGTGIAALEARSLVRPGGTVLGIDLSTGMLEVARSKADAADGAEHCRFQREDAEALSLADASYDAVLSLYALLHFPDPQRALSEMFRVLRSGGRVALAIGVHPPLMSAQGVAYGFRRLPFLFQKLRRRWLVAPALLDSLAARLPPQRPAATPTAAALPPPFPARALLRMMRTVGFADVSPSWDACLGFVDSVEEFWRIQSTFSSFARKRIQAAPVDAVDRLRQEFGDACRQVVERGGRLVYPYSAYYAAGRKP